MSTRDPTPGESPKVRNDLWVRVVFVAILAAAANLWAERHLGYGLDDPLSLLGITGGATAASMVLDRMLSEAEREKRVQRVLASVRRLLDRALTAPVLALLYLAAAIVAATWSSIIVVPPKEGTLAAITLTPLDDTAAAVKKQLPSDGAPARLLVAANPLGRPFQLSGEGYMPQVVTLYPLSGLTIDVDRDLAPAPTLLFRPPTAAFASLNSDGSRFSVFKRDSSGCTMLAQSAGDRQGARAFLLGMARPTPADRMVLWNLELTAGKSEPDTTAAALLAWNGPEALAATSSPMPGDQVYAVVTTRANKRSAEALWSVRRDVFQDIAMSEPGSEVPCPP